RMVAVVVDDENAVNLAVPLETPLSATKICQRRRDGVEANTETVGDGDGRQRVQKIMSTGYREPQRSEPYALIAIPTIDNTSTAEGAKLHARAFDVHKRAQFRRCARGVVQSIGHDVSLELREQRREPRIVCTGNDATVERHLVGEVDKCLLQVSERPVVLHMLVIDVGQHGDRRPKQEEGAIAFIGLRNEVLAPTESSIAAKCA